MNWKTAFIFIFFLQEMMVSYKKKKNDHKTKLSSEKYTFSVKLLQSFYILSIGSCYCLTNPYESIIMVLALIFNTNIATG